MRNLQALFLFFFFALPAGVFGQQLSFKNITTDDGLSSSEVYFCLQDHNGYIWFASDGGVCRYNGKEFRTFTVNDGLADNTVFHLSEDSDGRIWCDGFRGTISYIENDRVFGIPANDSLSSFLQYGQTVIRQMHVDNDGTVWISSSDGLIWINKADGYRQCHHLRTLQSNATKYATMCNDSFWLLAAVDPQHKWKPEEMPSKHELCSFDVNWKGTVRHEPHRYGERDPVFAITVAMLGSGDLILSFNYDFYRMTDTSCTFLMSVNSPPTFLYTANDQSVWLGTLADGVYCYRNNDFSKPAAHYLNGLSVSWMCEDREGGFWFTTLEKGVMFCPSAVVEDYRSVPHMDERINLVNPIRSGLMIGTYSGTTSWYNSSTDSIRAIKFFTGHSLLSSTYQDSNWLYLVGNIFAIRADSAFNVQESIYSDRDLQLKSGSRAVVVLPSGRVLLMNDRNIYEMRDTIPTASHPQAGKKIHYLHFLMNLPSRGRMLFLTRENEVLVGCIDGLYLFKDNKLVDLGAKDSLLGYRPTDIAEDKNGCVWIATKGNGLIIWDRKTTTLLSETNGLPSNTCNAIDFDTEGNAWVGTSRGLAKIRVNYQSYLRSQIETYDVSHGLISNEIMCLSVCGDKVWLGTNKGICTVKMKGLQLNTVPPPVLISSIQINDHFYSRFDSIPALRYDQTNFRFLLEGLTYKGRVSFVYKLEGFDTDWKFTSSDEIVYQNLPAGSYQLVVFAQNNDGIQSSRPAIFAFTIPSPFWFTWWFICLEVLAAAGVFFLILWLRLRIIRLREEEKTHANKLLAEFQLTALRAQMNPHFIFNAINSIQSFVLVNNSQEAYSYLAKFSRLVRMVLNNSQERMIPLEQELSMLNLYIELEQLRFSSKFEYELQIHPDVDVSRMTIPTMLIQPYVENSIWHGLMNLKRERVGKLLIDIGIHEGQLQIVVEDNGVGREKARTFTRNFSHKSAGMELSRQRVELMNNMPETEKSSVEVTDLYNRDGLPCGTRVKITVSVSYF